MANEKRLIDANALLIPKYESSTDKFVDGYRQGKIDALIEVTALAPTVDAVEVVRCKDCKHYKPRNQSAQWEQATPCCLRSAALKFPAEGFCSYGERRE